MNKKISFTNRLIAVIVTVIFSITLIFSYFSLPVELVMFNPDSYLTVIKDEEYSQQYSNLISNLLLQQIFDSKDIKEQPVLLSDQSSLGYFIEQQIPQEMSLNVMVDLFDQALDYFNFRKPTPSILVKIEDLKSTLVQNSREISTSYLNSLPTCNVASEDVFTSDSMPTIYSLPPCKPSLGELEIVNNLLTTYLQDSFNELPAVISITSVIDLDESKSENFFTQYSISRWLLRLLPLITLSLLIALALLLRKQRDVMFRWIGRTLLVISGFSLLGLVVLLIGFDQFIAITLNRFIKDLLEGFDVLMLGIIQKVGYQSTVWVIITIVITAGFGIFLVVAEKFVKINTDQQKDQPLESVSEDDDLAEEKTEISKAVIPETMEEIEVAEKEIIKTSKGKKNQITD